VSALFATVERAIAAIGAGQMVIVVDAADREDEGDLVMAAQYVGARDVHFMAVEGRGLVCVPMTAGRLAALRIDPMVARNTDPVGTAFHVSVDVRAGTTTGISASDRAATICALADPHSRPEHFARPGHVFPLAAREGGVLERAGHTEAAIDLVTLAGLESVAVICEIADSDGEMAHMPTLVDFAQRHQIPMVTIAELAAYRRRTEPLIDRVGQARLPLPQGQFTVVGYRDKATGAEHLALVHGDPATDKRVAVHVHTECLSGDVFGSLVCNCGTQLQDALDLIVHNGVGVILYRRDNHTSSHSLQCAPPLQQLDDIDTQILTDLGINPDITAPYPRLPDTQTHTTTCNHPPRAQNVHPTPISTTLPVRAPDTYPMSMGTVRTDSPETTALAVQVVG
jgi:3,4-dihydroxy 2-butanone 4-phosphate synthase / GTP cyclohydrolase II